MRNYSPLMMIGRARMFDKTPHERAGCRALNVKYPARVYIVSATLWPKGSQYWA